MDNNRIPAPEFEFRHRISVQLRFNDADVFGHVNNAMYYQYFDMAKLAYFRAVMGDDFDMRHIALVIVNANCNFYAPVLLTDRVEVLTATARVGEKSLCIEQRLTGTDGTVHSICTTVMAGFDPATMESAAIAPLWRERLSQFEGRPF